MTLFDDLVQVCVRVKQNLQKEKETLPSKLPRIPVEFANTQAATLFSNLKATHSEDELSSILIWNEEDQNKVNQLEQRLNDDPTKLASDKRNQKYQIDNILKMLNIALLSLTEMACQKFLEQKANAESKRQIAKEGAGAALKSASLDGVGSVIHGGHFGRQHGAILKQRHIHL